MSYKQGIPARLSGLPLIALLFCALICFAPSRASAVGSVTVIWNASPSTNVTGYFVYYGVQSATYTNKLDAGNATNATVSGLVDGTTYYFAVTAHTSTGLESDFSNEMSYTVPVIGNRPPTLNTIPNITINEDAAAQTVNLSGISSGATNEVQTLTVTATSSNPGLILNPVVNYFSPNATGTLTFSPVANANGSAMITVTVNDGQAQSNTFTRTFTVTVTPVNDPPTLNALANITINEDAGLQTVNLSGISSGATNETQTLTITATSSNPGLIPNPTVNYTSPNTTGSLTFTPVVTANGSATITVTVNDGQALNNTVTRTFTVTVNAVNDPPTLNALANIALNANAGLQTVNLSGITSGASNEVQTLTVTATSSNPGLIPNPTVNYTSPNATGSLNFTPVANANGTATITVTVNDGQALNNTITRTFTVSVNSVNNPPTLNTLANVTINEDAGAQTVALSGITSGATNEVQTLAVTATSSKPGLIPNPTVTYTSPNNTGTLTFTPLADANGTATITVTVDDGQPLNNTVTRTFTVTVNAVNDPPTLNALANLSINEDAGPQTVNLSGISSGATNEVQTLTVTATSSNPGLIPNPTISYTSPNATGTLSFTPAANANGTATITVTVNDGQALNNTVTRTFTVTVNAVNDPPTLNALANLAINQNASPQTVALSGITSGATNEAQTLTVTATSSNPGLIPNPTVTYTSPNATGTLTFTPAANSTGSATITVTVNDGQSLNNTVTRTFTVTVNLFNSPPTLNSIANLTINEDAATQTVNLSGISSGATNEIQTLTVTATSSNPALIPNPSVTYTSPNTAGTVTISPSPDANGTATITVTVDDGQPLNNTITRTFTVTVNAVNDPPTLNALADLSINEDAGPQTVNLSGISSGATNEVQPLTVTATSSNPGLIPNPTVSYTSPNATGSLTFTPSANANGTATITVTVNDGQALNNIVTRTFTVTVTPVNDPPTLNALANLAINQNAGPQTVALSGISSGAANEVQTLTVIATSSNPALIPNPTVTYTSPNAAGTLTFTPAANSSGSATITVTVNDGQTLNNTATRTFTVAVNLFNSPPTLNPIANVTLNANSGAQTVALSGITSGATNEVQTLTVTAISSNPGLIPTPTVSYTSPSTTGSLTFTPAANMSGTATISVAVDDGQTVNNTTTRTFVVTVTAPNNNAPTLDSIANITINEDAGPQSVPLTGITSGSINEAQNLTVSATSSNPGIIPNPTVTYTSPDATGSLSFTPVADANGTVTITVTVDDGQTQNNTVTRTFTVTVIPINDTPTLSALPNIAINVNSGVQTVPLSGITSGAANEAQTLTVSASSSNPGVVPNPTVNYSSPNAVGSLTFTPVANIAGIAIVTVTVNDGQAQNNTVSRTFTVTVNSAPSISTIANQSNAVNTVFGPLAFTIGDIETPSANLTLSAMSSNPGLIPVANIVFGGAGANRTVTLTPLTDQAGIADIAIAVNDGVTASTTTFQVFVQPPRPSAPILLVVTNGVGKVSGMPSKLVVGQKYTLTATAGANQLFASWSGTINSTNSKITFVATSNMVLQANFVTNLFIPVSGAYNGLFYEAGAVHQTSSGFFSASSTTRGTYSGRVQIGGRRYSFSGKFSLQGDATSTVVRPMTSPLTVRLHLGTGVEADQITGTVSDGTWLADVSAARSTFNSRLKPAPFAGTYTMVFPGQDGATDKPAGDGFGAVTISTSGLGRLTGSLADGTKISQSAFLSKAGQWPLYTSLYAGNGSVISWLALSNQSESDIAGLLNWIKPANANRFYFPAGFTNQLTASGSAYRRPAISTDTVLHLGNGKINFADGNLPSNFANLISLGASSRVSNRSTNALTLSFSIGNGTFSGSVVDPSSGKKLRFGGAAYQKLNTGYGFLLGTNLSSSVTVE